MKSVMEHSFSVVPRADIPRSSFDRSHGLKTTFDADYLIPILVDDVIPGDTFNVNANFFARLATPIHPIMDNLRLSTFFFFVPYRLLWTNWEKFCGAQDNPGDSISFTIPVQQISAGTVAIGALQDYMGVPSSRSITVDINALPFRAYNLIWNEWFRDQNLQNSVTVDTDNGADTYGDYVLLKRGKRHDYFTSCLPAPQRGSAVDLPLGTTANVFNTAGTDGYVQIQDGAGSSNMRVLMKNDAGNNVDLGTSGAGTAAELMQVDLSSATAATINELRLAFQTQRLLERDARSGTRYTETILAHYGVTVPDFRLQRPEYLGGGISNISVTPVANTTAIDSANDPTGTDDRYPGQLAGFGTGSGTHGFTKSFTEHGVIIGLANVTADITYCQGIDRYYRKSTRYDFYYPVLAQIGEQSVLQSEIFCGTTGNDTVFGYQERYGEYRYKPSRLTGLFNVDATGTLAAWHLAEDFSSAPTLNASFIESNTGTPLDRAIAVPSEPHIIADFYFQMKCARPMPVFGVPGNLDHF